MSELEKVFIKPGTMPDGAPMQARKPMGGLLAADGEEVVLDSHWRRRLSDGDVVLVDVAKATVKNTSKTAAV